MYRKEPCWDPSYSWSTEYVTSSTKLFADDLILYRKITSPNDQEILQSDLDNLTRWEDDWGMKFHPDKCETIHISRTRSPKTTQYFLRRHPQATTTQTKYLGIIINNKLEWSPQNHKYHQQSEQNSWLYKAKSQDNRNRAYKTLIRPILEYCSPVWNPSQNKPSTQSRWYSADLPDLSFTDTLTPPAFLQC